MENVTFYISIFWGVLIIGLLALVAAGKIREKTYHKIAYGTLTGFFVLSTIFASAILAVALIDLLFLKKFGYPIWSIAVMVVFTLITGALTRLSLIWLKRVWAS
jgi:hypothetical protein